MDSRDYRERARVLSHAVLEPFLRARSRSERQASGSSESRRAPARRERKMEVRVGERLLCLAVLSSVFFVDSVLGKYVKGIVNTKEVSAVSFLVFVHVLN